MVDLDAPPPGHVDHVQGHAGGNAQFEKLDGQVKVALQIGGIDDVDGHPGAFIDQEIPGHHLFNAVRGKRIGPGKIHDVHIVAVVPVAALFAVHRDAGIVAHVLARTGKGIKKGGLPGIGITTQCNTIIHCYPLTSTSM
jgi:hypothetical protein